jgi:hypothetical protein
MKTYIDFTEPSTGFWQEYRALWENSLYQSVYQAPAFLQALKSFVKGKVPVFKAYKDGNLVCTSFFYKRGSEYHFLSDLKTDHNFFILNKTLSEREIASVFKGLLQEFRRLHWRIRLHKMASWASYMDLFRQNLLESRLYWKESPYNPNLILEASSPEELRKITNKQKLRQKLNQLKALDEVVFESIEDESDLDAWLEAFFCAHINRWKDTLTPSAFIDPARQHFFKTCLKAWIDEGLAVRFSIKLGDNRISFLAALKENDTLIHHSLAFDTAHTRQSPGLVLISLIGNWLYDHQFRLMEFGDGGEAYKYQFCNLERPLLNFFICSRTQLPFILKANLISFVRSRQQLYAFYSNRVRPRLLKMDSLKKHLTVW